MIDREAELLLELQAALLTDDMEVIIDVLVRIDEWSMSLPEAGDDAAIPFTEDHVAVEKEVA
jgi:hypothetical protein